MLLWFFYNVLFYFCLPDWQQFWFLISWTWQQGNILSKHTWRCRFKVKFCANTQFTVCSDLYFPCHAFWQPTWVGAWHGVSLSIFFFPEECKKENSSLSHQTFILEKQYLLCCAHYRKCWAVTWITILSRILQHYWKIVPKLKLPKSLCSHFTFNVIHTVCSVASVSCKYNFLRWTQEKCRCNTALKCGTWNIASVLGTSVAVLY